MKRQIRCRIAALTIVLLLALCLSSCAAKDQVAAPPAPGQNEGPGATIPGIPDFSVSDSEESQTIPSAPAATESIPAWTSPAETDIKPIETENPPIETEPAPVETPPASVETVPAPTETEPTPVVTEPPQTDPPAKPDLTRDFTREDWKRINIFLSNFSEIGFDDYDRNASDETFDMLNFGYLHLKINDPSKLEYDEYYCGISQANMDKCLNRFFGKAVPEGGYSKTYGSYTVNIHYWDGAFRFAAGEGEAYNYLSVVYQMQKTDHNTYLVWFDVFELDIEEYFDKGISDKYYSMTYSEAVSSSKLTYCYSGTAEVRDYESGSFKSYQLISYDVD